MCFCSPGGGPLEGTRNHAPGREEVPRKPPNEANVTFTAAPADAQALHDGSLELSVGFMRGQVKMAGDFGALLQFLPLTHGTDPRVAVPQLLP